MAAGERSGGQEGEEDKESGQGSHFGTQPESRPRCKGANNPVAKRRENVAPPGRTHLVRVMNTRTDLPSVPPAPANDASRAAGLPEGVREGNENLVLLTAAAGRKVGALVAREQQGDFLRIAISGGGCNGLSYKLKFAIEPRRGDILVRTAGVRVLVDSKSALYLKGTHLDYSSALVSGGFKFSNPNAKASCSCGESFSV